MSGTKGIADVLRGLIADVPAVAWLLVVLTAVLGIFLAGYAMVRLYQANQAGDGTAMNWFIAFLIGSAMTCSTIVIAKLSFYFTG